MNIKNRLKIANNRSKGLLNRIKKSRMAKQNTPKLVSKNRDQIFTELNTEVANNINLPLTPQTCSGTSFQCNVAGSGKTKIKNLSTHPTGYDFLGTPIKDAGISGKSFKTDFILNWQNNSVETEYTKQSLKNTWGFENFQ
jgi:hypothetical protein